MTKAQNTTSEWVVMTLDDHQVAVDEFNAAYGLAYRGALLFIKKKKKRVNK